MIRITGQTSHDDPGVGATRLSDRRRHYCNLMVEDGGRNMTGKLVVRPSTRAARAGQH